MFELWLFLYVGGLDDLTDPVAFRRDERLELSRGRVRNLNALPFKC